MRAWPRGTCRPVAGHEPVEVGRALRTGNPARDGKIFKVRYEGMEVREEQAPGVARQRFITPHGEVTFGQILSETGVGRRIRPAAGAPDPGREDYKLWEYIAEHTYYDPCYEDYLAYEEAVGDDGYPMVSSGTVPSTTSSSTWRATTMPTSTWRTIPTSSST